jgi:hypothetical protein
MTISPATQAMIDTAKEYLPTNFINKSTDLQLYHYLQTVLADMNAVPPPTSYTVDYLPASWAPVLAFGCHTIALLFVQLNYSLKDFGYSDYGLSLNIDRVGKIDRVQEKLVRAYDKMVWNLKKTELIHLPLKGVGYPRYQTQIGQFLKLVMGSTFSW